FGRGLGRDLGRHLAGDAELIRLPALLADHRDRLLEPLLERVEVIALLARQDLGDARRGLELDLVVVDRHAAAPDFAQDLVRDGLDALHHARALARRARLGEQLHERFASALARHLDEAELADLRDVRARAIARQRL